jgi:hypothetical protein
VGEEQQPHRKKEGPFLWIGCALTIGIGYVLVLGPGMVLIPIGIGWAAYLLYHRVPGIQYGAVTIFVIAAALLAAWAIF